MNNDKKIWEAHCKIWASQLPKRKPKKKVNISILTPNVDKDKYRRRPEFCNFIINTALNKNNNIEIKGEQ